MKKGRHVIGTWVIDITENTKPSDINYIYKGKTKEQVKLIKDVIGDNSKHGQSKKSDDSSSSK